MKPEISLVIPCYNEERIIKKTYKRIVDYFKNNRRYRYEIIFVDDGSIDNTPFFLFSLLTKKNVKVVSYKKNKGKGYAVRCGLKKAKFKNILVLDADLSVDVSELICSDALFNLNGKTKLLIVGQRNQIVKQPIHRIFAGFCFRLLVSVLFSLELKDTQCPYKLFKNWDSSHFGLLKIDGFCYDVEVIMLARKLGIPIATQSVAYYNRRESKVTLKKTLKMFFELLKIKKRYGKNY